MEIKITPRIRQRKNMPAMTFDLSDFASYDVFEATLEEICGDLDGVYLHNIVSDDYIPPCLIPKVDRVIDKDQFGLVIEYLQLDKNSRDLIDEFYECHGVAIEDISDYLRMAESAFVGKYDDGAHFTESIVTETNEIPKYLDGYINWKGMWDSLYCYDFNITDNGYVFSNDWQQQDNE